VWGCQKTSPAWSVPSRSNECRRWGHCTTHGFQLLQRQDKMPRFHSNVMTAKAGGGTLEHPLTVAGGDPMTMTAGWLVAFLNTWLGSVCSRIVPTTIVWGPYS
jgi:hypothetical protein